MLLTWVEESLLKRLHNAPFISIMADECTDVTTIKELTICCHWVESCVPEENFIEILPLKKANAENIYSTLVVYCREKNNPWEVLLEWDFMELLFSLVTKQEFKEGWKCSHVM